MRFLLSNKKMEKGSIDPGFDPVIHQSGDCYILLEDEGDLKRVDTFYFLCEGYLRDLEKEVDDLQGQEESVVNAISRTWPLPDAITGSFSAVVIDDHSEISICTDLVGLYPLYYLQDKNDIYISNSIILMGKISGAGFDKAGILQRSLGPEFSNLGSRTILKDCKRLLPGECVRFNAEGELVSRAYDNSLYRNMTPPEGEPSLWKTYWDAYKKEVEYCLNTSGEVNIALSGGIDSRIALGAIPDSKQITSYTFGHPENYESGIAYRLSNIKKAAFKACYDPLLYFPSPEILKKYTEQTEAVQLCSWLEITENAQKKKKEPLLLGELCEALPARKIEKFSTKKFRQDNFFKYYILDRDYELEPANEEKFELWKKKITGKYLIYYHEKNLAKFDFPLDRENLLSALRSDLNEIFSRIEAHDLPFVELYDELFSWYTYTRMRLSKQLLVAGAGFKAYSPAMSLHMLRKTSSLHPNLRLNYRFAKKLFRNAGELKKLNRVPTSQAPLVPQNFPDLFKFVMWGFRSKADQFFIKRLMKDQDITKRYRLFKSINWAEVYQHPEMEENLRAYFETNHLGKAYFTEIYNQAVQRKQLKQWPFANMNIINAASLNLEIDSIRKYRERECEPV